MAGLYTFLGKVAIIFAATLLLGAIAPTVCRMLGWEQHTLNFLVGWLAASIWCRMNRAEAA